ncbi:hypothetical protein BD779DRAFT_1671671 [Infundibulicybe gibba]|nr:hypothetical protein BD779DRAFT_1671671 [Infundibulicybe gibba]
MRLPTELIDNIVRELTAPSHCLQYGHRSDVSNTLQTLCLVSYLFSALARPHLYGTVVIHTSRQLRQYHSTISTRFYKTHSLSIHHAQPFVDLACMPVLQRIFSNVLEIQGPHLRRLSLDSSHRTMSFCGTERFFSALQRCSALEEFSGILPRGAYFSSESINWRSVRRLALVNVSFDDFVPGIAAHLPALTTLVLVGSHKSMQMFPNLTGECHALQRLVMVHQTRAAYLEDGPAVEDALKEYNRHDLEVAQVALDDHKPLRKCMGAAAEDYYESTVVKDLFEAGVLWAEV